MALKYTIQLDRYSIQIADSEWSGSSMAVSPNVIQAINFDIEGENNDITAPIIKTSLSMTFVDAPDLPESGTMKCGDWEEFYTPDARRWKVSIIEDGDPVWAGFITPDSYTEELRYRGSVTLIARDGIGMLDDIMFDAEGNGAGMITPQEIIYKAVDLIDTHMYVSFGEGEADAWLQTAGGTMGYDTYIPVAAFKDKSWYEALEEVLTAYGACMRFINGHTWAVVSLRYLPKLRQLSWSGVDKTETPLFTAYATREMVPAVRSIHEVVDYETGYGKSLPMADAFSFTGVVSVYTYTTYDGGVTTIQAPIHPITSNNVWSGKMFFNPDMYGYDKVANGVSENAIFIPMFEYRHASSGLNKAMFTYPLSKTSGVMKMSVGTPHVLINGELKTAPQELSPTPQFTLVVQLLSDDSTYYYYNGETFVTTYTEYQCMPKEGLIEIPLSLDGLSGNSYTLNIMFYYIGVAGVTAYAYYQGMYACINSMTLERIGTQSYLSTNRVNTIYSESNNVKIDRNPMIGPAFNNAIVPSIIKNGIFDTLSTGAYVPAPSWTWEAGGSSLQLAVYNHLSIIPYYARPHNLLQGTILRESKLIEPNIIWQWNGQKHLLLSGSFDLLSGRINRAVLHEYDTYDELWGYESSTIPTVSASTDFSDSTNSGGSSSGGSGGGGGTSVTIDSAMSDTSANAVQNKVIKAYVDDRVDSIEVSGVVVDTAISATSTNPVQNKVIKSYIDSSNTAHTAALQSYVNTQIITVKGLIPSVDSSISSTSTNPVQNKVVKAYIDAQDVNVKNEQALALSNLNRQLKTYTDNAIASLDIPVVDSAISSTSTNAVQNKVIKAYVDDRVDNIEVSGVVVDTAISATSTNPVQNKVVKAYVDEAKIAAANAQSIANSASTAASNSQITANAASTAASNAQSTADSARALALQAQITADNAATAASDAQASADQANSQITDMSDDNKLTPQEKQQLAITWAGIQVEYQKNVDEASKFGVSTANYTARYNDLNDSLPSLLSNLETTSEVSGTALRSWFSNYYTERTTLLNAISTKAKELADAAQNSADAARSAAEAAQKAADAANEYASEIEAVTDTLNAEISTVKGSLTESVIEINARLDGVVENFFKEGTPTTSNYPVSEWKDESAEDDYELINHVGDTYTNIQEYVDDDTTPDAGKSWRWCWCDNTSGITDKISVVDKEGVTRYLHWHPIADSDAVKALQEAAKAQSAADGKARTFITTPTPPYKEGDLWVQGSTGDIMRCKAGIDRASGSSYVASDWEKASKYTDDTKAEAVQAGIESWMADGYFSPTEINSFSQTLLDVISLSTAIELDAAKYGVDVTAFSVASDTFEDYLNSIIESYNSAESKTDAIPVPSGFEESMQTYFEERQGAQDAIAEAQKNLIDGKAQASDLAVLTNNFKDGSVYAKGGLIMTSMVAVGDTANSTNVEAFLNGSSTYGDTTHGKLILAGGIPETSESGSSNLEDRAKEASTRIYEDGTVYTVKINAEGGTIGTLEVTDEGLTAGEYLKMSDTEFLLQADSYIGSLRTRMMLRANGFGHSGNSWFYMGDVGGWSDRNALFYLNLGELGKDLEALAIPYGTVSGLRPKSRTINSSTSSSLRYLTKFDHTIFMNGNTTVYLPSSPLEGQEYVILTSAGGTLNGNGKQIYLFGNGSDFSSLVLSDLGSPRVELRLYWHKAEGKWWAQHTAYNW